MISNIEEMCACTRAEMLDLRNMLSNKGIIWNEGNIPLSVATDNDGISEMIRSSFGPTDAPTYHTQFDYENIWFDVMGGYALLDVFNTFTQTTVYGLAAAEAMKHIEEIVDRHK